jgi:hypothetical protein
VKSEWDMEMSQKNILLRRCNMAQYYILNTYTGELHSQWEDEALAEETYNRLNRELPYFSAEQYVLLTEEDYQAVVEDKPKHESLVWSVYGVGKFVDGLKHDELVMAETRSEARRVFEKRYPHLRAVDAYQVNK